MNAHSQGLTGWENVVQGNAFGIAVTGMLIVFFGLTVVSICIAVLPKAIRRFELLLKRLKHESEDSLETIQEPRAPSAAELEVIIASVVHFERERQTFGDEQKITFDPDTTNARWKAVGTLRMLSTGE
jgi:Na+-transporting methylmalonyl-CoA/oxaloacetate decarboxylase gamma subunit